MSRVVRVAALQSRAMPEVTAEQLGEFSLLQGVSLTAREDLLEAGQLRSLAIGAALIGQGDANETMYLLLEGELAVYLDNVEGTPIAVVDAGEVVGELSLLDGSVASAHVVAHSPCRVLAVDERAFWDLTNDSHAFAVQLLVKLAGRLRANNAAVSESVEKRRMYERAAMFDGLTGIHNRRWLDETLHRLVDRSRRSKKDLSVSLVDIDHFKSFNDTYGHDAGDHVLTAVAATLTRNVRPTDLVARFGGEEFVIIFPETTLELASVAAERVREAIAATKLTTRDGSELPSVTISMGVSHLEPDQDVPGLLKVADLALYRAKHAGRNRVDAGSALSVSDAS
jgi:diguanylate cyclase (GGDEF)-like protein